MTFSILGLDRAAGEMGLAVQSKFPGVGSIVLHGAADAGAVATQAFANPDHGARGLALMRLGVQAAEALPILMRDDPQLDKRQVALLDWQGGQAVHCGADVMSWDGYTGHVQAEDCVTLGNSLTGAAVLEAMQQGFRRTEGDLTARLIAALMAGQEAGGEKRGQQSAAVLTLRVDGGYGGKSGRHVDISVYDHPSPIAELQRCYTLHRLSYFPSPPDSLLPIEGPLARRLRRLLVRQGYLDADRAVANAWEAPEITALERFMGTENYDNRIREDAFIDQEVWEDIQQRFVMDG